MAAVDGGTLAFTGQATLTAPAGRAFRLASMSLSGQATVTLPAGQPNFLFRLEELVGQASISESARMIYSPTLGLSGSATAGLDAQMALDAVTTMDGDADASFAANMAYVGELDIAGDAVVTADALDDNEGAVDFYGDGSLDATGSVVYNSATATMAGRANFVAIGLVRPPLQVPAPLPGQVFPQPFSGLRTDRPPHARTEVLRVDLTARTQRIDVDETAVSTGRKG